MNCLSPVDGTKLLVIGPHSANSPSITAQSLAFPAYLNAYPDRGTRGPSCDLLCYNICERNCYIACGVLYKVR